MRTTTTATSQPFSAIRRVTTSHESHPNRGGRIDQGKSAGLFRWPLTFGESHSVLYPGRIYGCPPLPFVARFKFCPTRERTQWRKSPGVKKQGYSFMRSDLRVTRRSGFGRLGSAVRCIQALCIASIYKRTSSVGAE